MSKKIVWDWENIDDTTSRVKVMGGWMIRSVIPMKGHTAVSTMFLHDTDWQWQPIAPYVDVKVEKSNLAKDFKAN